MARFEFSFDRLHRILSAPFGVTPETAVVEVADGVLRARLGPWVVVTPLSNISGTELTGPYSTLKTAFSARLSLVDRGLTMATNAEAGLCVRFIEPVRGIDPLGLIRHPAVTLTVARPEDLRRALTESLDDDALEDLSASVIGESPWSMLGRWVRWPIGMAVATVRYLALLGTVKRSFAKKRGSLPELVEPAEREDVQPIESGVGPIYERVYRVVFEAPGTTPEELIDRIAKNLNAVSPTEVAEFVSRESDEDDPVPGDEFVVRMPGPWDAAVRMVDRTPSSFRLATLTGHMEAGQIEFRVSRPEPHSDGSSDQLLFEIQSVARSADRRFGMLYEKLWIASEMQMHMWVHLCRRVVELAEGRQIGKVEVRTVRYAR